LKKNNFAKKRKKKEKEKLAKKKNHCECFVCGGTVNPPHGLVYLLILPRVGLIIF